MTADQHVAASASPVRIEVIFPQIVSPWAPPTDISTTAPRWLVRLFEAWREGLELYIDVGARCGGRWRGWP